MHAANKVARFLLNKGVAAETVIGVQLHDRPDLICTITGILNSRCVFVAIDDTLPLARLASMVRNQDLRLIICSRTMFPGRLTQAFPGIVHYFIEDILEMEDTGETTLQYPAFRADDSIYIYFTSGSTGTPKGIVGKNKSLLQFIEWETATFGINENSRVSQFITPYFDAFLRDVFVPLLAGATICVPPDEEDFFTPGKMVPWIGTEKITLIHCVPGVFRVFNTSELAAGMFADLAWILLSGEKIIPAELAPWYAVFGPRIQLVNLYGPSETTMIRSFYKIRPEDAGRDRIPIGHAISDSRLLVLNKDMKPCSTLVPGGLYILSDYMTKGYLNDPEQTKDKFISIDAFGHAYKTGDTARVLADGKIDLIGREDRQVKITGMRVELDEIENMLLRTGIIRNAVVIKHGENGRELLTAFIIPQPEWQGRTDLQENIRRYADSCLPAYMIPSELVEVSRFPVLNNGKINYSELLNMLTTGKIVLPENETEEKLLAIWKGILGDKPISTEDSFHRIGGNSLSIMRLIGRIYNEFNVRISLSELFNHLTIKKQAGLISISKKDNGLVISKTPAKDGYHLSAAQERLYYHYELDRTSTAFNLPMAWELAPELDKTRVETALRLLIEQHESLRTEFRFADGRPLQYIRTDINFSLDDIKSTGQSVSDAMAGFVRPFELNKAPLVRGAILTFAEGRRILLIDMHHIICDGMSQMNLLSDFMRLCRGETLTPLDIQYKDYAEWEYTFRKTDEYLAHREFWLESTEGGVPKLNLPVLNDRNGPMPHGGENLVFSIGRNVIDPVLNGLKDRGITAFSGLFAMYFIWLSQITGQEDMVVGINTAGRVQDVLNGVVGMFAKTLPIRYKINTNLSFNDFAAGTHAHLVRAHTGQFYDLSDIVREWIKGRDSSTGELVEAMFVFQNFNNDNWHAGDTLITSCESGIPSKFPVSLFAGEDDKSFHFRFEYSPSYFSKADMALLAGQFSSLVSKIAQNPEAQISEYAESRPRGLQTLEEPVTFNF